MKWIFGLSIVALIGGAIYLGYQYIMSQQKQSQLVAAQAAAQQQQQTTLGQAQGWITGIGTLAPTFAQSVNSIGNLFQPGGNS
jgi:type II secretory pathway pseudopilin PulG